MKFKAFIILILLIVISGLALPQIIDASADDYPKLANYFIAWDVNDSQIAQLAKWDIVILSPQALERNPQLITKLRKAKPQIKILVYVLSEEINVDPLILNQTAFWQAISQKAQANNWWLLAADGKNVSVWPSTWMINVAANAPKANGQNWSDFLPDLVYEKFLKSDAWDGVFYDNVWDRISWTKQAIDTNGDRIADAQDFMDKNWQDGLNKVLTKTRALAPGKMIVANTNTNLYNNYLNGRMQESFPANYEGSWTGSAKNYLSANFGYTPKYFIINANSKNTGNQADYQNFRFGLTSTLLGDGYYSFDYGDKAHDSLWWYDEYDFFLGRALSQPNNLLNQNSTEIQPGVWQRNFQNALVVVNSTETEQKITLNEEYEKLKGSQDTTTNNGAIVKSLTLKARDGIVLLRRIVDIKTSPYFNGSFVRAFNKFGNSVRNGFFIYNKDFKGGNLLVTQDINHDGQIETIVADESKITIYDSTNNQLYSFYPYGNNYKLGINFDLADFENDGNYEIVTGTMKGYAPLVKIFTYKGEVINQGFNAYAPSYQGGVTVAVCANKKQIVTGTGFMGGPQVRIFDKNGKVLSGGFFAYGKTFRGGVNVSCGDIDGNGIDEIVTGAGYGGSSHVLIFNSKFVAINPGFFAFGKDTRTGVRVILNDIDGDGSKEILAASPTTFTTSLNHQ